MFNIPDYQHQANLKEMDRLKGLGFEFEVTSNGYFVKFQGQGIGGAGVLLPRKTALRGQQAGANRRDFLSSALLTAKHSEFYR